MIVAMCGFMLLGRHLEKNYPFLISVDPFTYEWNVVAYPQESKTVVPQYQYIQEKLVNDFFVNWFTISANQQINDTRWRECSATECANAEQFNPTNVTCALSCKSDPTVYQEFVTKVLPEYRAMIGIANETWTVKNKSITPVTISENDSKWQIYAAINSHVMGEFNVLIFVDVARENNLYPATVGYHIKQFNAYRISR